jgi:ribonucleoside-triphosphate reductase
MKIIKRSGQSVDFDPLKIERAITQANDQIQVKAHRLNKKTIQKISNEISDKYIDGKRTKNVEYIQDEIEKKLIDNNAYAVAKEFITYRYKRNMARVSNTTDDIIMSLVECDNEEVKQENSNKNPVIASTQRDYVAGEVSKDLVQRLLLPRDIIEAHNEGIIHFHDSDYFLQHIFNCCLINLDDMLQNGTVISGTMIEKPHSFSTACNIATQIIAQVASNQYGGQTVSLTHLAPFVDISRQKIRKEVIEELLPACNELSGRFNDLVEEITQKRVREEVKKGIQTIQYQVVTLMTTNGQAPFLSVVMYLNEAKSEQEKADLAMIIEEMLHQRIQGVKNEKGIWVTIAFPKLLYVLEEDNCTENSKYWYLTELAAKCTAKRMVPDYISEKIMKENKINQFGDGDCYGCMGCRSFLTPWTTSGNISKALNYEEGKGKYYGRFNQGVVTINLVDAGLSAEKDLNEFWKIFDERLELCHKALQLRHERLATTLSDTSPIHWQHGAIARLDKGECIHELLHDGYSTISLGYAGLWECVYALIGKKLTEPEGEALGLQIMQYMNDKCKEWKAAEKIDYSVYGTPIESTTYKFAKGLQKRFGIIKGVTDKNYITNSYHIHVTEPIDAFTKLATESKFQKLSPGGAISYVEVPNLQNNIPAVLEVIKFIYNNIMYAELNSKSDYCHVCGWDGEISIVENEDHKLIWDCPNCHNQDQSKMNIARRVCGYISTNEFNQGRTQEIKERVLHLGNE